MKQNLKFAIMPTKSFCLEDFDEFGSFANRSCTKVLRGEQNLKFAKRPIKKLAISNSACCLEVHRNCCAELGLCAHFNTLSVGNNLAIESCT